jgi:cobalt-zinc-cadmium efflux system outer membrane protein
MSPITSRLRGRRLLLVLVPALATLARSASVSAAPPAPDPRDPVDAELASPVERALIVRVAVARNRTIAAAMQRAHATELAGRAEASLPPPEAMVQVWQVPVAKPYALDRQMIMVGVSQAFPAPGSRAARQAARVEEAHVEEAAARDRARLVARQAAHAFADYVEATARHAVHRGHLEVAARVMAMAEARQASGGALTDVTQADVEKARVEADVITDATLEESARGRINVLLGRAPALPLGAPRTGDAEVPAWTLEELLAHARAARPELRAASAAREARRMEAEAAAREATWPAFSVAALYFAPTASVPEHGYGVNASMSLPWLWGAAGEREEARRAELVAATTAEQGAHVDVDAEVVAAAALARSAALRLGVLEGRALPATKRGFDAAWSAYASGQRDVLSILAAERAVVDVGEQIVVARAALDHALADLDAAVGLDVPRAREPVATAPSQEQAHAH